MESLNPRIPHDVPFGSPSDNKLEKAVQDMIVTICQFFNSQVTVRRRPRVSSSRPHARACIKRRPAERKKKQERKKERKKGYVDQGYTRDVSTLEARDLAIFEIN